MNELIKKRGKIHSPNKQTEKVCVHFQELTHQKTDFLITQCLPKFIVIQCGSCQYILPLKTQQCQICIHFPNRHKDKTTEMSIPTIFKQHEWIKLLWLYMFVEEPQLANIQNWFDTCFNVSFCTPHCLFYCQIAEES